MADHGFTLGVVGASGGVGTSTLAAALATRAALGAHEVLLLDLDAAGGGADVLLGCDHEEGIRWPDLAGARGPFDGQALLERLPRSGQDVAVLAPGASLQQPDDEVVVGVWESLATVVDLTVIDLGRQVPVWVGGLDAVLLLVRGDVTGLSAAVPVARRLIDHEAPAHLIGRGLEESWTDLVCSTLGLPLLGAFAHDDGLREDQFCGRAPGWRRRARAARCVDGMLRDLWIGRTAA